MRKNQKIKLVLLQAMLFITGSNAAFADIASTPPLQWPLVDASIVAIISIFISYMIIRVYIVKLKKQDNQ